jgi:hypothetical protein
MMFYNPHSYDCMKEQLNERMMEMEQIRRAERMEGQRPPVLHRLVAQFGRRLVQLGTRLEQPGQPAKQIGS